MPDQIVIPDTYKDPSGFVFTRNGIYHRHVTADYAADYDRLIRSGLYEALTASQLLIRHEEIHENVSGKENWHVTLLPEQLPSISFASEWITEQLKDAALHTLTVARTALQHGMILKDATPFNIQFHGGRPLLIDSLSFERYDETKPWRAYRQFCECFLFPLYIHHYLQLETAKIAIAWPDGIPAAAISRMLPAKALLNGGALMHVFLQSSVGTRKQADGKAAAFNKNKLENILHHLERIIRSLNTHPTARSAWSSYYEEDIQSTEYLAAKEKLFLEFVDGISYDTALDIGANNGRFSWLLARKQTDVVAVDADWQSIHQLYTNIRKNETANILPLCVDVSNPTPATGFMNKSHASFVGRMQRHLVAALAVVHHLVLGANVPIAGVALLLASLAQRYLIVEFVPLEDEKSALLIRSRDRHHPYGIDLFEQAFSTWFVVEQKTGIGESGRVLYLMKRRDDEK